MRLATFHDRRGDLRTGAVVGEHVIDLTQTVSSLPLPASIARRGLALDGMMRLLHSGADGLAVVRRFVGEATADDALRLQQLLRETRLAAPVPRPGKIVAIGRNYADHAKETGVQPFERPRIIAKLPSSVVGPDSIVRRPEGVTKLDLEAELAVVIGQFASRLARGQGLTVVAGYTALNDVSAREFQFDISPAQTTFAKSMDGFCPMGPWLVTADEVPDPQDLEVRSFLNGNPMQHGNTRDMLFSVDRIIEYVSRYMTLEPGDVIATGTPAGSGAFREPPVWLKPGDRVRIDISRIGTLEHRIG